MDKSASAISTELSSFTQDQSFFVGIDSDGCVFDSMEIKHKECFCPAFINHFGLQPASKYAREVWEFVNLYSRSRGANRFRAVLRALELCASRLEIQERQVDVTTLPGLQEWVKRETKLGNPALIREVEATSDPDLKTILGWSLDVNESVARIVRNVPPFPGVVESLERLRTTADTIVVSQTPTEALVREWAEQKIDPYVKLIAGQEIGTKGEHLAGTAGQAGDRYAKDHILMIGDAPGDRAAADSVGALFYPVIPGREEESWHRFTNEALDRFLDESYAGAYQTELLAEFDSALPELPPWESR